MGTTLTPNHGHAALFGVFGMLALAVLVFCLRAMQSDAAGVIQLWDSIASGYWHARCLTFLMGGVYHKLEWLRMVGDMVFLVAGALPITLGALRSVWKRDLSPTA